METQRKNEPRNEVLACAEETQISGNDGTACRMGLRDAQTKKKKNRRNVRNNNNKPEYEELKRKQELNHLTQTAQNTHETSVVFSFLAL